MEEIVLSILVIAGLAILALFVLPRIRMKRAVNQVVAIFEHNNARDVRSAKTIEELRLQPRTFLQGVGHIRDFKPYALQALMNAEVIRQTEDGRFYLVRDKLDATNLARR